MCPPLSDNMRDSGASSANQCRIDRGCRSKAGKTLPWSGQWLV
jgi:hypothetical protein